MTEEIYIEDLLDWYNEATRKKIDPLKRKAVKKVDKLEEIILDFKNSCENLSTVEPSAVDKDGISAKSAQRLSQKYIKELDSIDIPKEPYTYEEINRLKKDLGKLINTFMLLGRKLIPRLSQMYKKEIQEINFYFQNLGNEWKKLNKFIEKKYMDMLTFDQIQSKIERIQDVFQSTTELKLEEREIESEIEEYKKEKDSLKEEFEGIKQQESIRELSILEKDFSKLKQKLLGQISSLRKAFSKFEKVLGTKYTLPEDIGKQFTLYNKNAFKAFINEEVGYPKLKAILDELDKALQEKDLDLSAAKSQRAISKVKKIQEDSLIPIQKKINELMENIEKIKSNPEIKEAFNRLTELENKMDGIQVKIDKEKVNLDHINENYDRNIAKIIDYRTELIQLIKNFTKKEIDLIFEEE
ncbi:MAG: hypothetical protein EU551_01975 [Promethearchaeota archaeon]|nr:MAG: hypothetical protein EU551_01975 [Candidatus Lokiarchaeota archaeon]